MGYVYSNNWDLAMKSLYGAHMADAQAIKPLDIYDIYMNASVSQAARDKQAGNVPYPFPVSPGPAKKPEDKADTINPQLLSKRLRDW